MLVNEIFYSLQGEGLNMGRASIFIRLSKCNLSCSFCDTNGTRRPPHGLDYITCSPKKEAMRLLHRNFPDGVGEFRFPIGQDIDLPPSIEELPPAEAYLLSPIFIGEDQSEVDPTAVALCVDYILQHPEWRLSLQVHKLIHIP